MKKKTKCTLRKVGWSILGSLGLFQIYLFIRLYLLVSCVIPTSSMSPTFLAGDYIIASLRIPGRRELRKDGSRPGHCIVQRKAGTREVRKGDITVFNFPYSKGKDRMIMGFDMYFCKRCMATPGDTYHWLWNGKSHNIYLPRQGEIVKIDSMNFHHYNRSIEYETGLMPKLKKGIVVHADTVMHSYRFKCNYYFMCGDNYADSYDSRFWGILPEDFILGVGLFTWFSKEPKTRKIRWERMFRKL